MSPIYLIFVKSNQKTQIIPVSKVPPFLVLSYSLLHILDTWHQSQFSAFLAR
jgi:hypothetical protein